MLLGVFGAGWWALTYVPLYFDHFEVKSQVEAVVLFEGVGVGSEKQMLTDLSRRLASVGSHYEIDEETQLEREVRGIVFDDENAEAEVTQTEVRLRLRYERKGYWKFTDKPVLVQFEVEKSRKLKR